MPPAVLSPLADRFGPGVMMIAGYLAAAAAALAMAAAGSLAFLDAMAAVYGAARSLSGPAASALPPRVVQPDDLLAANSLLSVTSSIGQVAGPLAASVLLATVGFGAAFAADAATYLAGVVVLLPLPLLPAAGEPAPESRSAGGRPRLRAATAGAVAVARDPGLRLVALALMAVMITSGGFLGRGRDLDRRVGRRDREHAAGGRDRRRGRHSPRRAGAGRGRRCGRAGLPALTPRTRRTDCPAARESPGNRSAPGGEA